ncbi:acyltransferase [Leucobacter sp. BZR 635]
MSLISTPPAPYASSPGRTPNQAPARRDAAVDLVRAACLIAVVAVHAIMVGVSVQGGEAVLGNALEPWSGFTVFSWFTQMMPLFFIAGGFASATHYRRQRGRGVTAPGYVASRLGRLLPVPLLAAAATTLVLTVLTVTGVDPTIVATAGWRMSQPLWFLGVYVLCSALVPAMLALHERAPRLTLTLLGAGILAIDGARFATGVDAVGFANLLLVWLFVQQLGFFLADGIVPGPRTALAALGFGAGLVAIGASPANLFEALNPPTAVLALLGVIQLALFAALRPKLERLASVPAVRDTAQALNARAMTIYSWHMPVTVLLAGLLLVATGALGGTLPLPLGSEWWLSRPAWLAAVAVVVTLAVLGAGRLERRALAWVRTAATPTPARAAAAAVTGGAGVLIILAATGALWAWIAGSAFLAAALLMSCERRQKAKAIPSSTP